MTHLEALLLMNNRRKRDSWAVYGEVVLPSTQTEFAKDMMFQLSGSGSIWDGCLFYIKDELHLEAPIIWSEYTFNNSSKATIMNSLNIVHPSIFCFLTATDLALIVEPVDISFIAFASLDPVDIEDDDLNLICLEAGVPFITLEELEFKREDILRLMIQPALEEYYKWYPIIYVEQFPAPKFNIDVPMPIWAKNVQRAYINPGYPITGNHQNPITRYFDEVVLAASSRGTFSSPSINYRRRQPFTDIQGYSTFLLEKAVRQGAINHGSRKRIRVELHNRRVTGYSNIQGLLEIEWGTLSYKWSDIPFNRVREVRDLATAKVLRALGSLRSQINSDLPGTINYDSFMTRADKLEEDTIKLWQENVRTTIARG
jgi:hypothetical protein